MYEILLVAFLVVALVIICLVLVQHGKGADMGASFGAGASATLFGSSGSGNFLTRSTSILGLLFFILSLLLANLGSKELSGGSDFYNLEDGTAPTELIEQLNIGATDGSAVITEEIILPQEISPLSDIPE